MQTPTWQEFATQYELHADVHGAAFEVVNDKFLRVNLGGMARGSNGTRLTEVWTKKGSIFTYSGEVKFERAEHGFKHAVKTLARDEGPTLVHSSCVNPGIPAQLLLADKGKGKNVVVLRLVDEAVVVNGNDLLAFDPNVKHKITKMRKSSLEGHGFVAILTHGKPLTFPVSADLPPVFTDAEATVAWSGNLTYDHHTDVSFGESFQMKFMAPPGGRGFVIVQPFEEHPPPPPALSTTLSSGVGGSRLAGKVISTMAESFAGDVISAVVNSQIYN